MGKLTVNLGKDKKNLVSQKSYKDAYKAVFTEGYFISSQQHYGWSEYRPSEDIPGFISLRTPKDVAMINKNNIDRFEVGTILEVCIERVKSKLYNPNNIWNSVLEYRYYFFQGDKLDVEATENGFDSFTDNVIGNHFVYS